jgi:hypothetical protein
MSSSTIAPRSGTTGLSRVTDDGCLLLNLLLNCVQEQIALAPAPPRASGQSPVTDPAPPKYCEWGGVAGSVSRFLGCKSGERAPGQPEVLQDQGDRRAGGPETPERPLQQREAETARRRRRGRRSRETRWSGAGAGGVG